MRIHSANAYSCDTCDKKFATKQQLGFHIVAHTTEAPHVCKTCGARFKYECSLVKHYRQHMYPTAKKEKIVLDVKPGEKMYKKIVNNMYKSRKRGATAAVKAETDAAMDDSFAFPASPAPASNRRSMVMPEMVDALDDVSVPSSPARARKVVALQEPQLFEDAVEPPLQTVFYEEVVHTAPSDMPPPLVIMTMEDGQQTQVVYEVQAPDGTVIQQATPLHLGQPVVMETEAVEDEVVPAESLEWDEELNVAVKPSTRAVLKDLALQVPNINIPINRLFPALAEGKKTRGGKKGDADIVCSVDLEKLVKVGILDEYHDPAEELPKTVQVEQRRKPVPLSKKPMPLKWKKVTLAKLNKPLDPSMAPALSPRAAAGPPILEKISSMLHAPRGAAEEEEDGPPVLTKMQPRSPVAGRGRRAAAVVTPGSGRPTRSQAAAAAAATASPAAARSPARPTRGSGKKPAPSPTKTSKFKQEEGYEPYDWGFSDDESGSRKKRAAAAEAAKKAATPRGRGRPLKRTEPAVEESEGDEEEEDDDEPEVTQVKRGRGRLRKPETPQAQEKKAKVKAAATPAKSTPAKPKAAPPKATPSTRALPQRSAATPQTRTGPPKVPPKAKAPPKATPPTKQAASKAGASKSDKEDSTTKLPLKKRPAALKDSNTPQSGKKGAPSSPPATPKGTELDTSPVRKSARSQKPTERMLEYLQDKALVGKVKAEPGTEIVLEIESTPGKPLKIREVVSVGKKGESEKGKVAQTKASKTEALKAKAAALAKAKADKLKKSAVATKRKASPSPADAPPDKRAAGEAEETGKKGRGRPKGKGKDQESPSKFKSRKSASEMIEEYAANLLSDLKNKAKAAAAEDDSEDEDETQDPLKSSSGRRSNRSGSISGKSNQDDSDTENPDLNWEHSRIIRRRASSEEEDDDEEEDIKIIRRARRASSKSPKAKQMSPGRSFGTSPGASPAAKLQPPAEAEEEDGEEEEEEEGVTVEIRAPPLRNMAGAAALELVEDLHDDEGLAGDAIENDHLEGETEEPMETEEQVAAAEKEAKQAAEDAEIGERVGAISQEAAEIAERVRSVEQAQAMADEIRALTQQANVAIDQVEPQAEARDEVVEIQVNLPVTLNQLQQQGPSGAAAHSVVSSLQVPDIRIQAPSPIVEHGDSPASIPAETYAPVDTAQEEPATNGIEESLLGAISSQMAAGDAAAAAAKQSAAPADQQ